MRQAIHILVALLLIVQAQAQMIVVIKKPAAGADVTFDTSATGTTTGVEDQTSIPSFNINLGAISNGAVVVVAAFRSTLPTGITVTVGGSSAAVVSGTSRSEGAFIHSAAYCVATGSATGNQAVAISWTGNAGAVAIAASFANVDQTTPCDNGTGASYSFGVTAASIAITSAAGSITYDGVANRSSADITSPSQTFVNERANGSAGIKIESSRAAGSASNTHAWTTAGTRGVHSGLSVRKSP